ncbi:MAG: hypothetical protein AABW49_00545 [Nanoarchaeota archaeon]
MEEKIKITSVRLEQVKLEGILEKSQIKSVGEVLKDFDEKYLGRSEIDGAPVNLQGIAEYLMRIGETEDNTARQCYGLEPFNVDTETIKCLGIRRVQKSDEMGMLKEGEEHPPWHDPDRVVLCCLRQQDQKLYFGIFGLRKKKVEDLQDIGIITYEEYLEPPST